jgi:exonuclease SbcC
MQKLVEDLLGLKYEHFMQSVVLPQGGFAQFLHAEKRERQDLLVSLLGMGVYEQVMKRANALADQAHTRAATLDGELLKYADATDDAEQAATHELSKLRDFQQALPELLAPWKAAAAELEQATELSSAHEADVGALAAVRPPVDLDTLARQRADATAASTEAAGRVAEAEQHEADTEQASQTAGKPSDWQNLITLHDQLGKSLKQQEGTAAAVTKTAEEAEAAQTERDRRQRELGEARTNLDNARTAHAADHLASGLEPGAQCPVCRQIVAEVPQRPPHPEIDEAQSRVDAADQSVAAAEQARQAAQRAADRAVDERDRLAQQVADLHDQLADRPDAQTAATAYESAEQAETAASAARQAARDAREVQRKADETSRSL